MKAKIGTPISPAPILYISYAHEDRAWRDEIVKHLAPLQRNETIRIWDDQSIRAGDLWQEAIQQALDESSVALVLVSAASLSSNFIRDVEIRRLLEKRDMGDLKIIPVLLSPCAWQAVPWLASTQIFPRTGSPLEALSVKDLNSALKELAQELQHGLQPSSSAIKSKGGKPLRVTGKPGTTLGEVYGRIARVPTLNLGREAVQVVIKIKRQLVGSIQSNEERIIGLGGPTGSGKTVLANVIAQDEEVRRRFFDGAFPFCRGSARHSRIITHSFAHRAEQRVSSTHTGWSAQEYHPMSGLNSGEKEL